MDMPRMDIRIKRLTPALIEDYLRFFDTTPHATGLAEHKCYCVWYAGEDCAGHDLASSVDARRAYAARCVASGLIQGYLAYAQGRAVGWCNANTKADCLLCYCWRRFMGDVPLDDIVRGERVKSVFCFAVTPQMRRAGVSRLLLARVVRDAAAEGFACVEAYPGHASTGDAENYTGPAALFEKAGFETYCTTARGPVMRRRLAPDGAEDGV